MWKFAGCNDFFRIVQSHKPQVVILRAQNAEIRPFAHNPMSYTLAAAPLQGLGKGEISILVPIRAQIVGPVIPLLTKLLIRNELVDFNITRAGGRERFQVFAGEDNVFPGFNLVPLSNLRGWNLLS